MPPLQASTLIVPNAHLLAFQIGMGGGNQGRAKGNGPCLMMLLIFMLKCFGLKKLFSTLSYAKEKVKSTITCDFGDQNTNLYVDASKGTQTMYLNSLLQ